MNMKELTLVDYSKKKLDDTYLVVYMIKNEINLKKENIVEPIDLYTMVGVNKKGFRELLGIYPDRDLDNRYWLDIFETMKARGLKNILFITIDDNKNFKKAVKIAFPEVTFVDALTYVVPKFEKYTSEKSSKKTLSRIHKLYTQETLEEYRKELENFKTIYSSTIHQKLIKIYLSHVEDYYKYSYPIRSFLFKPTANVRIYHALQLFFHTNKNYVNDLNEVYEKLEKTKQLFGFNSFNKNQWSLILNDMIELYAEIEFI